MCIKNIKKCLRPRLFQNLLNFPRRRHHFCASCARFEKVHFLPHRLFPCVFTHPGDLSLHLGRWVCVKVLITQDISWRSLTGSSSDIIPGELAVVLHPAISEAENISLTNYLCIMNIIVSVGQMLSLLATWFRFLSCSFRMHFSGIQKKKKKRSSINSIFNLEYLSYKLTAKGKIKQPQRKQQNKRVGLVLKVPLKKHVGRLHL